MFRHEYEASALNIVKFVRVVWTNIMLFSFIIVDIDMRHKKLKKRGKDVSFVFTRLYSFIVGLWKKRQDLEDVWNVFMMPLSTFGFQWTFN